MYSFSKRFSLSDRRKLYFRALTKPTILKKALFISLLAIAFSAYGQNSDSDTLQTIPTIELSQISGARVEMIEYFRSDIQPLLQDSLMNQRRANIDTLGLMIDSLSELTEEVLVNEQFASTLDGLKLRWSELDGRVAPLVSELSTRNKQLEKIERELKQYTEAWTKLRDDVKTDDSKSDLADRIGVTLSHIDSVFNLVDIQFEESLEVESLVTELVLRIKNNKSKIDEAKSRELISRIMERGPPLFVKSSDSLDGQSMDLKKILWLARSDARLYLEQEKNKALWFIPFVILFLFIFYRMKNNMSLDDEVYADRVTKSLFRRPWLSAIFYGLLSVLLYLENPPALITLTFATVMLTVFLLVFLQNIRQGQKWVVIGSVMVYLVFEVGIINLSQSSQRVFLLIINVLLSYGLYRIYRSRHELQGINAWWVRVLLAFTPVLLLIQIGAFVTNVTGYHIFSLLLIDGTVTTLMAAVFIGLTFQSLNVAIRTWFTTGIPEYGSRWSVEARQKAIRGLNRILQILSLILFAQIVLNGFYIFDALGIWWSNVIEIGAEVGDYKVTLSDGINFFKVVVVTWLTVGPAVLFLREEILTRLDLERGVPMAISSITSYTLVTFGVFLALSQLGFNFANLGLLAGALGVGIGFGLQSIINNFLSGLILVFERPITEGDIVKIQLDEGEVIKIGIRATTLRLYDASELIVPNSDIVSQKVINWTLANKQRRLKFEFVLPVADLDPTKVVYLIEDAMKNIIQSNDLPEPAVFYDGIEENKAKFYIHFWVEREILYTKNRVYTEIHRVMKEHGIGMIVPSAVSLKQVDEHLFQDKSSEDE